MYDNTYEFKGIRPATEEESLFEKEMIYKMFKELNAFFTSLIEARYQFSYNSHYGVEYISHFSINFGSRDIGNLEYYYDDWYGKIVLKDYKKHTAYQFTTEEEAIKNFKKVYFPILEAEDIISKNGDKRCEVLEES